MFSSVNTGRIVRQQLSHFVQSPISKHFLMQLQVEASSSAALSGPTWKASARQSRRRHERKRRWLRLGHRHR